MPVLESNDSYILWLSSGVEDPDVRRLTAEQPVQWYHAYQHVYMAALYSLLTLKGIFFDDFHSVFSRKIGQ